jgi:predicted glycogen debranching enzyme
MMVETSGEGAPLTWMDGEIDGSATTGRVGKQVEVNALWFNYLKFGEYFDSMLGVKSELFKKKEKFTFKQISRKAGSRFGREFWNRRDDYLYDYVSGDEKMEVHRGNQAIVLGLPFSVLEVAREKKLIKLLEKEMIAECGIRSIHPTSAQYVETLPNDLEGREIAYFQGTIWPFLLEFYVRGGLRLLGNSARVRDRLKKGSENLYSHVNDRIPGFIPELYTSINSSGEVEYVPDGKHAFALSSASAMSIYQLLH